MYLANLIKPALLLLTALLTTAFMVSAQAHNIADGDAAFVAGNAGAAVFPFIYLGAKHMVTGYDHLLFLAGVVFFLSRPGQIVQYVTLFAVGHSITLIFGVLADIHANAYLIDAVIALSVVYKALENMGALDRLGRWHPDTRLAVLVFGLFHGFGLATSLQELELHPDGLVINLISFNVGVEIGQIIGLSLIVAVFTVWRKSPTFDNTAFISNAALMSAGFMLLIYQLTAWQLAG
ncbi:HupE/UreJ family protein [Pseudohongiella sp.]|uniref:HupE / UreJ protein n=1 Tax=marine sediment metagenome TaxID=412755 RepID=A0A0F9Z5E7_9ZZZZ|nr:HupE/UreJ family protein [Pseudohongiella sp.]HDZ07600.1 HupE/UreJ family protein [Pseudohongiella sp.]HEA63604.1 HupE/UreJ family protein [Pseudohongiella sp.]